MLRGLFVTDLTEISMKIILIAACIFLALVFLGGVFFLMTGPVALFLQKRRAEKKSEGDLNRSEMVDGIGKVQDRYMNVSRFLNKIWLLLLGVTILFVIYSLIFGDK